MSRLRERVRRLGERLRVATRPIMPIAWRDGERIRLGNELLTEAEYGRSWSQYLAGGGDPDDVVFVEILPPARPPEDAPEDASFDCADAAEPTQQAPCTN